MPTLEAPVHPPVVEPIVDDITRRQFVTGLAGAVVLAGCGGDDDATDTTDATPPTTGTTAPDATTAPPTATPQATKRIAALDPRTLDILVALKMQVVAAQPSGTGLGIPDYVATRSATPIEVVGDGGQLFLEALAKSQSDLLIGISDLEEQRSTLAGIAPLHTYESALYAADGAKDWRSDILEVGRIAEQPDGAAALIDMLAARFAQTKAAIGGKQRAGTAIMRAYGADGYRWYAPGTIPLVIADEIGLVTPAMPFTPEAGRFVVDFSVERVPEVNASHVFVSIGNFDEPGTDDDFAQLDTDPLWRTVPAVAAGNVARIQDVSAWFIGGPLGWQVMLDELEAYFATR